MSKFQLYINNQRVELFKDENVSLTETIQDVRDVSKVFTDFTKPFTLPASDTNNKIFKHYYKFNLVQGYTFDARKKIDAKIELNTIPYKEGKIALEGVETENGKPKAYKVTFYGNTVNLKDVLGDDQISGLTWLSNFNTTYSANEINTVMTSPTGFSKTVDSVPYSAALIVPLISNTQRFYYNNNRIPYNNADGTINSALGGNLNPTGGNSPTTDDIHGVLFEDLTYAIKMHLIVKAIQEQYSELTFSDDFLDLTNGPDTYKKLYMLCQKKEGRVFDDLLVGEKLIDGFATTANLNIAVSGSAVRIFNLNPSQSVTGIWTLDSGQAYPTFTAVLREGNEEVLRKEFTGGTNTIAVVSQQITNTSQGYTLTIETTSAFDVAVTFEGTTPNANQLTSQTTSPVAIAVEKEFVVQQHLPNIKVIDFLTGLFSMFNLTAFVKDGIIHVKTLESFYNAGTLRDITKYVDPQSVQINKALPYREIEFRYKGTETTLAKQHFESQGVEWGAAKYVETGDLDSNNNKFEIEVPFAHMKYERINGTNTDIQWGFLANEKNEPFFKNPVVFIGDFVTLPTGDSIRTLSGTTAVGEIVDITEYWMPSNTAERDATVSKESIHFDLELSEWDSTAAFTETLFDKYHRFYIAGIFNSAKRLTTITARLPKKFVINYTLADTVIINQDRYKINSITTDLLSGSSRMELLNETVNDATITQDDTGGTGGQTGVPNTNVLTLFQCANPNSTFESSSTIANLNLAINTRVQDASGNTYRVTGNNVPNTHTSKTVTSMNLTGCPAGTTPPPTNYYGLKRCSDNATNLRTSTAVGSPTYAITQQVFDSSNVKYVIENASTADTVPSITIASTPSPVQLSCSGNQTTTFYYQLNPCCSGTTFIGFSANNSLSGTRVYNNQTYVISPSSVSGTIDIDSLPSGSCTTYYYSLNSCTNGSIQHYGTSNCSNLNNTQLTYSGTCYSIQTTTNQSGSINLDSLSSCTCSNPVTTYYLLRDCQTASIVVTTTTTTDIPNLTVSSTPANASLVQDNSSGKCYTVNATTTDPSLYSTQIGQVTSLGSLGCPSIPCGTVLYYQLQQCSTGSTSFITGQTTTQISLSTGDFVHSGSTSGPLYKVLGTTTSGTSVGTVVTSTETACPTFYELKQCYTLQTGYRSGNSITEISLSVNDRVSDPNGMPYTVTSVGVSGGGFANVGTVTDLGASGCPSITGSSTFYNLQRCSDSTTGYLSLQQTSDVTFAVGAVVGLGGTSGPKYQVAGVSGINTGIQIGVVADTGTTNCITPVIPPPPPPATTSYARFVSCIDQTLLLDVYSSSQISTWWVISEVGQFECYRWDSNTQGTNPIELNSQNFNFFTTNNTAGANCLDCQNQAPPPPPPPPPPAQTCFQVPLYKSAISAIDLCNQTQQRTMNLDAATIQAASKIYINTDCSSLQTNPQYVTDVAGSSYWYWNGSTLAGPYTPQCP